MSSSDRIVLIDDDRVVGEIVSALAKAMGLQCEITRTPEEFFDRVGVDTSVILLDLVMPEMDGIEILRLLGEKKCKSRIVLMSGINIRVIETAKKLAQSLGLSGCRPLAEALSPSDSCRNCLGRISRRRL